MFSVSYPIAFISGLASFFAPCVVPLLPAYISFITGASYDKYKKSYQGFSKKIFLTSIYYISGFSIIFVLMGTTAAGIGIFLRSYQFYIYRLGGLIMLILGLEFAGIINLAFLAKEKKFKLPSWTEKFVYVRAFLLGVIFAIAWTPCVGAVLGSILALAAVSGTVFQGATMLFVYSLGISIPFLVVSMTLSSAPKYVPILSKNAAKISKFAGILLAIIGLMLLTGVYAYVNSWILNLAFRLGYEVK